MQKFYTKICTCFSVRKISTRLLFLLLFIISGSVAEAQNKVTEIVINTSQVGTVSYGLGSNATYLITLNTDGSSSTGFSDLSLNWAGAAPVGVTYSFAPASPVTIPANSFNQDVTLTLTSSITTKAGTYNFTVSSTNDVKTSETAGFIVDPKLLTISATGNNKVYDGNTTATVTLSDDRINSDVFTTSYITATFDTKDVGTGKAVSVSGISISGADAANYTYNTITSTTADITIASTSIVLSTNITPACQNTPVIFTATITSLLSEAYGSVEFFNGAVSLGTAIISGNTASISTNLLDPGNHLIRAVFVSDNPNFSGSNSTSISQQIDPYPTIALGTLPDFCPNSTSFNLVYVNTTGSPVTYSISSGTPALTGFVPIIDALLAGSPLTIALPASYSPGTYQFIITIKNANGCSFSQSFDVNLRDLVPPTIFGPADVIANTNTGCTATGIVLGTPTTSDNCSVASVTNNAPFPAVYPLGITEVIWTVTDGSGNVATHTQKVTVIDQVLPVALCRTTFRDTLLLDASGRFQLTSDMIDNGMSSDNCGIFSKEISVNGDFGKTYFDCSNLGRINYVGLRVTDNSGNQNSCSIVDVNFGILVLDTIKPIAITKNIDLYLDASGKATLLPEDIDDGSSGNCTLNMSVSKSTFDCTNLGPNTVNLIVKDSVGINKLFNTTISTAIVTIKDNIAPVANCKDITVTLDVTGNVTILGSALNNGSTDNCSTASLVYSVFPSTFNCTNVGNNVVTVTVTDASGNFSTCTSNVLVKDGTAPTALAKPVTIFLDNTGIATLTPEMVDDGSFDLCGPVTLSLSKYSYTCSEKGVKTVTLTVKDVSGNTAAIITNVTIVDAIAPTANCKPFTLMLNASTGLGTLSVANVDNGSFDNCASPVKLLSKDNVNFSSTLSYNCADVGIHTVYFKITDASGNSSTCTSTVTIQSTLTITQMVFDNCTGGFNSTAIGGKLAYTYYWEDIGSSGQDIFRVNPNPENFPTSNMQKPGLNLDLIPGIYTIRLTVTDVNGCSVSKDLSFEQGSFLSENNSDACFGQTIKYTSSKSGTGFTYSWVVSSGGHIEGGGGTTNNITIRWDEAGPQTVRVENKSKVVGSCTSIEQNNVTVHALPEPTIITDYSETVCPQSIVTYTLSANTFATRTWSVTGTGATIIAGGGASQDFVTVKWGSVDGAVNVTVNNSAGTIFCSAAALTINISVEDDILPTIIPPPNVTVNSNVGKCNATGVSLGTPVTNDNCSVASVTNNAPATFPIGSTTVTWTVKDFKGNTATGEQTVTVVDNQFPVITIPKNQTGAVTQESGCSINISITNPSVNENCAYTLTWVLTGATTGSSPSTGINYVGNQSFNLGVTTVTYTATDASGNSTSGSSLVTVTDKVKPIITFFPPNISVAMDASGCTATGVDLGLPEATDNCSVLSITNNAPAAFKAGPTNVKWTITDGSGNLETRTQVVTVTDMTPPTLTCLDDITAKAEINKCGRNLSVPYPIFYDNCILPVTALVPVLTWVMTGATEAQSPSKGINAIENYYFNLGTTNVEYTITDASGNSTTCSFNVTVTDDQPPTLSACPTPLPFYANDPGKSYKTQSFTAPTATDNCSTPVIPTWSAPGASPASGSGNISGVQFPIGSTVVTYTATDAAGNSTSCIFTVVVVGRPEIACPADIVSCSTSLNPGVPAIVFGTAPVSFGWVLTGATTGSGSGPVGTRTFGVGVTTITWTGGNTAGTSTCTQKVTVNLLNTWLGITPDWNDAVNWCPTIPGNTSDIVIPSVGTGFYNPLISTGTGMVRNITINSGASVTINGDGTLQVAGDISNQGIFDAANGTLEFNGISLQIVSATLFKDRTIKNLTISNSAGLNLALPFGGNNLDITGAINFGKDNSSLTTNDNLTLKSTHATGTASVGVLQPGNDIVGNVIVERFIPTGSKHGKSWQLLAIPTGTGQSIKDAWQEGATKSNVDFPSPNTFSDPHPGYGTMIVSNSGGSKTGARAFGFDEYTAPGPSMKSYVSANNTWDAGPVSTASLIYHPKGYLVLVRGDRSVNNSSATAVPTTLRTKGPLFTPKVGKTPPVTNVIADRFESVGNPYASPIDLRKLDPKDGVGKFYYVWDPNLTGSYGLGAWQTLGQTGKVIGDKNFYPNPGGGSYGTVETPHNYIESGQAFLLSSTSVAGSLTINESNKWTSTTIGNSTMLRGQGSEEKQVQLRAKLYNLSANGTTELLDGVLIQYDQDYSNAVDKLDARKVANSSENLAIRSGGKDLVVERRSGILQTDTIFYKLTTVKVQKYRFEFIASQLREFGVEGFIEDTYLGTKTPLNMEGKTSVDFAIVNIPGSYASDRFRIVFKAAAGPLPVTFVSVKAAQKGSDISVDWKVENERNLKAYEVEKSVDGVRFVKTSLVSAGNNSVAAYTWLDKEVLPGWNYYRIKSIDLDGKISYSEVVKVQVEMMGQLITVYPNPIVNGVINVHLVNQPAGNYKLRLLNPLGQTMVAKQITREKGTSIEPLTWDYKLARGNYRIEVTKPDGGVKVITVLY